MSEITLGLKCYFGKWDIWFTEFGLKLKDFSIRIRITYLKLYLTNTSTKIDVCSVSMIDKKIKCTPSWPMYPELAVYPELAAIFRNRKRSTRGRWLYSKSRAYQTLGANFGLKLFVYPLRSGELIWFLWERFTWAAKLHLGRASLGPKASLGP